MATIVDISKDNMESDDVIIDEEKLLAINESEEVVDKEVEVVQNIEDVVIIEEQIEAEETADKVVVIDEEEDMITDKVVNNVEADEEAEEGDHVADEWVADGVGKEDVTEGEMKTTLLYAGMKTSLILAEERLQNKDRMVHKLEEELRRVYKQLLDSLDENKKLKIKCETLEQQIDKIVTKTLNSSTPKAQSSPPKPQKRPRVDQRVFNGSNRDNERFRPSRSEDIGQRFGKNRYFGTALDRLDNERPEYSFEGMYSGPVLSGIPRMLSDSEIIANACTKLEVPNRVNTRALQLFQQCKQNPNLKTLAAHDMSDTLSAACIHICCGQLKYGITYNKVYNRLGVTRTDIDRCSRIIMSALGLNSNQQSFIDDVPELITQIADKLSLPQSMARVAAHVSQRAIRIIGQSLATSPLKLAAGSLFLVSLVSPQKRSLNQISQASGVDDSLIINSYSQMRPKVEHLFPFGFQFGIPLSQLPVC